MPQLSHGHQKEHVKSEDRRPRGGEQWKKKENNSGEHRGAQPERKHRSFGVIASRPYASAGAKKKGEGDALNALVAEFKDVSGLTMRCNSTPYCLQCCNRPINTLQPSVTQRALSLAGRRPRLTVPIYYSLCLI